MQGVYPTAEDGEWVAISVRDDTDWANLAAAMSRQDLLADRRFRSRDDTRGRRTTTSTRWSPNGLRTLSPTEIVDALGAVHVPAEWVLTASRMYDLPQLAARGYYEEFEHPVTGRIAIRDGRSR